MKPPSTRGWPRVTCVVVEGAERLREGSKVELKGPGAATPAKPAAPAKAK